jgi:hypothetical protein
VPDGLGRRDGGRDALIRAAPGRRDEAIEAWRRRRASGAGVTRDAVAQRRLPPIAQNSSKASVGGPPRQRFQESLFDARPPASSWPGFVRNTVGTC